MGRITTREVERMTLITGADLAVTHLSATFIDAWAAQENVNRIHQMMEQQGHPKGSARSSTKARRKLPRQRTGNPDSLSPDSDHLALQPRGSSHLQPWRRHPRLYQEAG